MKLMIYPWTQGNIFTQYADLLEEYKDIVFAAPAGWKIEKDRALDDEDQVIVDNNVKTDYEKEIAGVDAVYFADSEIFFPMQFLKEKIEYAVESGKKVFLNKTTADFLQWDNKYGVTVLQGESFQALNKLPHYSVFTIPVPVVFVMGLGPNTGKLEVQLALRRSFTQIGYKVSQLGSNGAASFFGFSPLPAFLSENRWSVEEKIIMLNHFLYHKCIRDRSDVLIIGVPGGIMPLNPMVYEDLGIMAFLISQAVRPDVAVLNLYSHEYSQEYFDELRMICKYRYNFDLEFLAVSSSGVSLSSDTHECEFTRISTEVSEQYLSSRENYRNVQLFRVFDKQDMKALGDAVIERLAQNL